MAYKVLGNKGKEEGDNGTTATSWHTTTWWQRLLATRHGSSKVQQGTTNEHQRKSVCTTCMVVVGAVGQGEGGREWAGRQGWEGAIGGSRGRGL